eukprot:TRINITY_DN7344_c0_g1_i1.p1 TRINITY_DN7344_c0_g1~~TRINITY_DN7344_c0_g1_i1.p1  ORF type:complete len:198 (+),score=24.77 TRINITY_DN7344_c0_g1_i1:28-621(+)
MGCGVSKDEQINNTYSVPSPYRDYDLQIKILLVGDFGVGKTSMILRVADFRGCFSTNYISTIGVDFKLRDTTIDGKRIRLQIWDTGGQERFRTISSSYYRGVQGVIVVYDITDEKSFNNLPQWLDDVERYTLPSCLKFIVGNKSDLHPLRSVDFSVAQKFAEEQNIPFLESSAKQCVNIEDAFMQLANTIYRRCSGG